MAGALDVSKTFKWLNWLVLVIYLLSIRCKFLFTLDQQNLPSLCVKWMDCYVLNGTTVWEVAARKSESCWWQRLMELRDELMEKMGDTPLYSMVQHGKLNTDLFYNIFQPEEQQVHWSSIVWNRFNLPKVALFAYMVFHGRIASKDKLRRFGVNVDSRRVLCMEEDETQHHLFFEMFVFLNCFEKGHGRNWICATFFRVKLLAKDFLREQEDINPLFRMRSTALCAACTLFSRLGVLLSLDKEEPQLKIVASTLCILSRLDG